MTKWNTPEEADDAVQSAIVKVLSTSHPWDGRCLFKSWFLRVVVNERLMQKRKLMDEALRWAKPLNPQWPTTTQSAETVVIRGERMETIRRAMAGLNFIYYQAFVMFYVEEMTTQEIADQLHEKVPTIKGRIYRAREAIKAECSSPQP